MRTAPGAASRAPMARAPGRRASAFSPAATASSRSATATSGANRGIFAIMSARVAGMNSMLRTRVSTGMTPSALLRVRPASHHRGPHGHADRLTALVDPVMLEGDDAGLRPGPRPARLDHVGHHVEGVAGEHRGREIDPGADEGGE